MATAIQIAETTRTRWFTHLIARLREPSGWSPEREDVRFCAKRQRVLGREVFIEQWPSRLRRIAAEEWDSQYPEASNG